ncbi:HAD-IA family hydrolase [Gammaproteobacteria bacterium]|mgnify:FL=1|nr:HAD-IA family hydrolase [Gammaproteobacteria bacterium]
MVFKAILWDFGGVLTTSPFDSFNDFEREKKIPLDFIRGVNAVNHQDNAWAQLESSLIDAETFDELFFAESHALGHAIRGAEVLSLIGRQTVRPRMVDVLRICKESFMNVCLTNNARTGKGLAMSGSEDYAREVSDVIELFDEVIESSKEGIRKPDRAIYSLACDRMQVDPREVVYLDDLGVNLKPARDMGMSTIKVVSESQAISDLSAVLDIDF